MIYKDIPSFPGYKISKEGVVIGKRGNKLEDRSVGGETTCVILRINGKRVRRTLHSLLLETWCVEVWKKDLEPDEEWKVINGYDDYIITTKGRVWSKKTSRWMKPTPVSGTYYWTTGLRKNNKNHTTKIHMIVGRNFLPDYKEGLDILHREEELPFPEINYVDNLWVGTDIENHYDRAKKGRCNRENKFGYMGVKQHTDSKYFSYQIGYKGKLYTKGGFLTALEAHKAYLAKRMELKGY